MQNLSFSCHSQCLWTPRTSGSLNISENEPFEILESLKDVYKDLVNFLLKSNTPKLSRCEFLENLKEIVAMVLIIVVKFNLFICFCSNSLIK